MYFHLDILILFTTTVVDQNSWVKNMRFITQIILYYFGVFRSSDIEDLNLLLLSKVFLFYIFP